MFDGSAFRTWPHIIIGASVFAFLFAVMVTMGEALLIGQVKTSLVAYAMGAGAFCGYVSVAALVRREESMPS